MLANQHTLWKPFAYSFTCKTKRDNLKCLILLSGCNLGGYITIQYELGNFKIGFKSLPR